MSSQRSKNSDILLISFRAVITGTQLNFSTIGRIVDTIRLILCSCLRSKVQYEVVIVAKNEDSKVSGSIRRRIFLPGINTRPSPVILHAEDKAGILSFRNLWQSVQSLNEPIMIEWFSSIYDFKYFDGNHVCD